MNIDTMRRIDRALGVPLCFLTTLALRLKAARRAQPAAPRRVLFLELSEMGSTILADPAMRRLRDRHGAELHFAIFAQNRASLGLLDTIPPDNIFTLRSDSFALLARDALALLRWMRRRRIDTVLDLELFSRFTALLTGLSGAANRVGFHRFHQEGLYRGDMLTHPVWYNPHVHIAKNFVALVDALAAEAPQLPYGKVAVPDAAIRLAKAEVPAAQVDDMAARVAAVLPAYRRGDTSLVLVNPNAGDLLPQRRWPPAAFVALIRLLLAERPDTVVLLTGAPGERAGAEALRDSVASPRCGNFAGGCAMEELPALYSLAAAMVTNDSGPAHFAAVTAMPTVVLFGPETPALYGSLGPTVPIHAGLACSPCVNAYNHRKTPCTDNVCLQAIRPEQVLAALRPLLPASGEVGVAGRMR